MCLFNYENYNITSQAYKYGITKFECGGCPECLQKKSRNWALRASMEAKTSQGMMITLTYDTYKYDEHGNIIGENLRNDLTVNKKDAQNFIKRLRAKFPDKKIKYLLTAEYGKRTHRPHYHALIFGLVFDDLRTYKKSKRGNVIYRSKTLEKIWQGGRQHKGGICTVDSINLSAKTARYCTKYCAKDSGVDDTFMLFSRGIGEKNLLKEFNGKSFWIEGREYPIPRQVWQKIIESSYGIKGFSRYVNKKDIKMVSYKEYMESEFEYKKASIRRGIYTYYRDNDERYKRYIEYWRKKSAVIEKYKPSAYARILSLDENKYRSYKAKAINAIVAKEKYGFCYPPRTKITGQARAFYVKNRTKIIQRRVEELPIGYSQGYTSQWRPPCKLRGHKGDENGNYCDYAHCVLSGGCERCETLKHLPSPPCHNTANDSIFQTRVFEKVKNLFETEKIPIYFKEIKEKSPFD